METLIQFAERIMADSLYAMILGLVAAIAPLYFLKTVYAVWFGTYEVFIGFKSQRSTWLVLGLIDGVALFTLLPARESGLVMQIVMIMWMIEMFLIYAATFVRKEPIDEKEGEVSS